METKLEEIGFYTLEDKRAKNSSSTSPMWRCEQILTSRCNFRCGYCRGPAEGDCEDTQPIVAAYALKQWCNQGLKNIRFSGGEPMVYKALPVLVSLARNEGVERIAISTNGSFKLESYKKLIALGVNDFSISLDADNEEDGDRISGNKGSWKRVISNIKELSKLTYVTLGVVLTEDSVGRANDIIAFAHSLGPADIRIITSAQFDGHIDDLKKVPQKILDAHPILKYRVNHIINGRSVRGIKPTDSKRCGLVKDDSVIKGKKHYPCVIYLREHGEPIGEIGRNMRQERVKWSKTHNTHEDSICKKNCLDVCIDYNNTCAQEKKLKVVV